MRHKKLKILILSFLTMTVFLSCQNRYERQLKRGIYSIEGVKSFLPEDVPVMDISGEKYLRIPELKVDNSDDDYLQTLSSGNRVIAVTERYKTIINDHEFYCGRIDTYIYNSETDQFEIEQQIISPFKHQYHYDVNGKFVWDDQDGRALGYPVKLYGDYLIADVGQNIDPRPIQELEGIMDKTVILKKLKEMDYVFDEVLLYHFDGIQWSLKQVFNAELRDDPKIIEITENGIGLHNYPRFGHGLDITDGYCMIVDDQGEYKTYLYKQDEKGIFKKIAEYPIKDSERHPISMSSQYSIRTNAVQFDTKVEIINNQTTEVESVIESPLYPENVSFGMTLAILNSGLAFIGEPLYGFGSFSSPETENFEGGYPGYVHVFNRDLEGTWEHIQTITSPLGVHYEQFGKQVIANDKYLVIVSQPSYTKEKKPQPGIGYIYRIQADKTYKLVKVIIGIPEKGARYSFSLGFDYINFFQNGILYEDHEGICYIPDVFSDIQNGY